MQLAHSSRSRLCASAARFAAVIALFVAASGWAASPVLYRWVDSSGKVNYGDVVPDRYKASARPVGTPNYEGGPQQVQDAKARAERERQQAQQSEEKVRTPATAAASGTAAAAGSPAASSASVASGSCEAEWKRFADSNECYAPFFTQNGIRGEAAFEKCGAPVTAPTCGAPPARPAQDRTY